MDYMTQFNVLPMQFGFQKSPFPGEGAGQTLHEGPGWEGGFELAVPLGRFRVL